MTAMTWYVHLCHETLTMDDLKANADDMDEEEAATNFGNKFLNAPWGLFKIRTLILAH